MFVNVGAYIDGERATTKKALKEAVKENPSKVFFDCTEMLSSRSGYPGDHLVDELGTTKLSVVGPDPYTSRRWYATVEVVSGGIKVS